MKETSTQSRCHRSHQSSTTSNCCMTGSKATSRGSQACLVSFRQGVCNWQRLPIPLVKTKIAPQGQAEDAAAINANIAPVVGARVYGPPIDNAGPTQPTDYYDNDNNDTYIDSNHYDGHNAEHNNDDANDDANKDTHNDTSDANDNEQDVNADKKNDDDGDTIDDDDDDDTDDEDADALAPPTLDNNNATQSVEPNPGVRRSSRPNKGKTTSTPITA